MQKLEAIFLFLGILLNSALTCLGSSAEMQKKEIIEGIPDYVPTTVNLQSRQDFQDAKFGIFIHWGVYSMLAEGECVMNDKGIPFSDYSSLPAGFFPSRFNASEWVGAIRESGAKYITFTSRHVDGFAMFKSEASDYNIVDATPFGRDVVGELAEECRKQDIRLHFYYSLADWGRQDYPTGVMNSCPKDPSKSDFPHYLNFICAQLNELLSDYGPVGCIWLDCDWDHIRKPAPGEKVKVDFDWQYNRIYKLIHGLQPACLIGNNHHRESIPGEDIQIFERDLPGENSSGFSRTSFVNAALPLETCQTMNKSWGYSIKDKDFKSSTEIIRLLVRTAGTNANLLLNVGPQPDGRIPAESLERLSEIGVWMKTNGDAIYGTRATLLPPQEWGVVTHKDNTIFLHVLNRPAGGAVTLPFSVKAKSVKAFGSGTELKYRKGKDSFRIFLPDDADCTTDYIVEIIY